MQLRKYETPLVVEELVFQVNPDCLETYLDGDYEIFTKVLEQYPGFAGSEIWVSADRPGCVRNIVFWKDRASFQAVDTAWVIQADARLAALVGEGNMKLVEQSHTLNQMLKVREYR